MSEQNARDFKETCKELFHKGNTNRFNVHKNGKQLLSISVTLFIVLLVAFCPATLIAMLVGLFCGCKYSFSGPDIAENNDLNRMFDQLAEVGEQEKK